MQPSPLPITSLTWQGPDMRVQTVSGPRPYVPHCGSITTLQTAKAFTTWQALVVGMGEGSTVKQNSRGIWVPESGPFMVAFKATQADMLSHFARWGTA